jgi:hypothetical protein
MPLHPNWLALCREIPAATIDSLTGREAGRCSLPVGTRIEDAIDALLRAESRGDPTMDVRAHDPQEQEWVSIARIATSELRAAITNSVA